VRDVVAALDLGGTHASAGLVDLASSQVNARTRVDLPTEANRDELLDLIVGVVVNEAERLGVSAPGPFDYGGGVSWIGHKLQPLLGVDLRVELSERLGLRGDAISFVNDAEAFLIGEWWAGAAAGHDRAVGVTLGTGLGSAFLEQGRPVTGGPRVPPQGAVYLLSYGEAPVEEAISRAAIIARYGDPNLDVDEIADRAHAGDERAVNAFFEVARALGDFLARWLNAFEATCLVVGGSIAQAWDLLEPGLAASLEELETLETVAPAARLDDAALLGAARHAVDGERAEDWEAALDPQLAELRRERIAAGVRPLSAQSVAQARADQAGQRPASIGHDHALEVVDLPAPVPIRLFRPSVSDRLPVCIWLPGGGWVVDTHAASEPTCRHLAAATPCAVAAVRYPLAPEHRFPAALEDCVAAVRWLVAEGARYRLDPSRLAIGGTSAGANLAAAVTIRARDERFAAFAAHVLVYAPLLSGSETTSMQAGGDWVFLDRAGVEWCWSHYLVEPAAGLDPLASPLRVQDLHGLPPALILTGELDPLRDEGELYAARLRSAGVPATAIRVEGAPHGFFSLGAHIDVAERARRNVVAALRDALLPRDPS
jgi:acetyl esterase